MNWFESFKAVGRTYVDLLRTEVAALRNDLAATGRRVGGLLLLLAAAAFILFWALGVLVYLLIEVLTLWMPRWGAALAVLAFLLVVVATLALVVRRRWSSTELPVDTVRRRVDEHMAWWESRVLDAPVADEASLESGEPATAGREIEP